MRLPTALSSFGIQFQGCSPLGDNIILWPYHCRIQISVLEFISAEGCASTFLIVLNFEFLGNGREQDFYLLLK